MNLVWISILTIGLGVITFNSPELAFSTIMTGSEKAVELSIKLWSIYAVWLGVLRIVEDTGLDKKISKLLNPVINRLMGKFDPETQNQIAINITSNIFGMGNASTPSGIKAIEGMYKGEKVATTAMLVFLVLNTTNLQIIPTTIISLRILNGSQNANNIIFPTLIASAVSTVSGVVMVLVCSKIVNIFKKLKFKKSADKPK